MSEFHVNVVRVGKIEPHPNADTLSITKIFDYQIIVKTGQYQEGELVVYVPVDSIVPDIEHWHFLVGDKTEKYPVGSVPVSYRRIKAKKLRGIFSQGMLYKLPENSPLSEGDDVIEMMCITKYEEQEDDGLRISTNAESPPTDWAFVKYTDMEGLRRYPNVLVEGEEVILTEKIHGINSGFVHDGDRLWVRSKSIIRKPDVESVYWNMAFKLNFEEKLKAFPFKIFFGEVYGKVQDLKYGLDNGYAFRCFDIYDVKAKRYVDYEEYVSLTSEAGIDTVPVVYKGPWNLDLNKLCEGKSALADHVKEGFVVKPVKERWHEHLGRVIFKRCGEGYLLRK